VLGAGIAILKVALGGHEPKHPYRLARAASPTTCPRDVHPEAAIARAPGARMAS